MPARSRASCGTISLMGSRLSIALSVLLVVASRSGAQPLPPYTSAPPTHGSWAGRAPGTFVEVRHRWLGRTSPAPATRASAGPAAPTTQASTRAAPLELQERLVRFVLFGHDTRGFGIVRTYASGRIADANTVLDWVEQPVYGPRVPGFDSDDLLRTAKLRGFRRDVLAVGDRALDCFVRTYASDDPWGTAQRERWTLAETDDERHGSRPDAMIVRERGESTSTRPDGRVDRTTFDVAVQSIETVECDGQPITAYRLVQRGVRPDGQPLAEVQWFVSPQLPGYTLRYAYTADTRGASVAAGTVLGSEVLRVGVDAEMLTRATRFDRDAAARASEGRLERRDRQQAQLREVIESSRNGNAGPERLAHLFDAIAVEEWDTLDERWNGWSNVHATIRAALRSNHPAVTRAAAKAAASRGLPIAADLERLAQADPEGLNAYVGAAAKLGTIDALPVLLRGATGEWSYIRTTAASALAELDVPQAADALGRLATDGEESVRLAILRPPPELDANGEAKRPLQQQPSYNTAQFGSTVFGLDDPAPIAEVARIDYSDDEWFNESDDSIVRPTLVAGAPGAAIFRRLPLVNPYASAAWLDRPLSTDLLITLSRDVKPIVRQTALYHLGMSSRHVETDAARARLSEAIDDADPNVATLAINLITRREGFLPDQATIDRLFAKANLPTPVAPDGPVPPAVNGAAMRGLARLGDDRVIPIAIEALKEPMHARHGRALSAASVLRTFATEATLDVLLRHAKEGPNARPCAHALSTLRDPRAAAWLLANWTTETKRFTAAYTTQPTSQRVPIVHRVRNVPPDGADADEPVNVPDALAKGLIRSADHSTIASLRDRAAAAAAATMPVRPQLFGRNPANGLLNSIRQHRRGQATSIREW